MIPVRALIAEKGRNGLTEMERVLCFAYHLAESGQPHFSMADLRALDEHVGLAPILVGNAAGYAKVWSLMQREGRDRWSITTLGRKVVEALPNRDLAAHIRGADPRFSKPRARNR